MKRFNTFILKIMAIIFMTLDHVYTYSAGKGDINIPIWFGYLGKLAAPIFFYLIVEGFFYTKSRKKYSGRLLGFAGLMAIIDIILDIHNNVFLSLGLGVILMSIIEYCKENKTNSKKLIFGVLVSVLMMFTEASYYGLGMILTFYFFREKKVIMSIVYIVFSLLPVLGNLSLGEYFTESIFLWDYQWMMVFSIIFINMYNGKLGLNNKCVKWFFYGFYPIHLIIIVLISNMY
ncbi:TraX family protein [Clostridium sp. CTA-5]